MRLDIGTAGWPAPCHSLMVPDERELGWQPSKRADEMAAICCPSVVQVLVQVQVQCTFIWCMQHALRGQRRLPTLVFGPSASAHRSRRSSCFSPNMTACLGQLVSIPAHQSTTVGIPSESILHVSMFATAMLPEWMQTHMTASTAPVADARPVAVRGLTKTSGSARQWSLMDLTLQP